MLAALMALGFMVLIYWFLAGRPRVGRLRGNRVYLRRGPGVGGLLAGLVAVLLVGSRVGGVGRFLWLVALLLVALAVLVGAGALAYRRSRR